MTEGGLREALEKIAHMPAHEDKHGVWLTNGAAVDIACQALGFCRECRHPLILEGSGCHVCGATLASMPEPATADAGWMQLDEEHGLPLDLQPGDELRRTEVATIDSNEGNGRYGVTGGIHRRTWWYKLDDLIDAYRRRSR